MGPMGSLNQWGREGPGRGYTPKLYHLISYFRPLVSVPEMTIHWMMTSIRRVQACSEMHVAAERHKFHPILHPILALAGEKTQFFSLLFLNLNFAGKNRKAIQLFPTQNPQKHP